MRKTNYFHGFDKILYNDVIITNLLNRAKIKDLQSLLKTRIFDYYSIRDGERPETIAEAYYGSTNYFWIILYANNIKNIYDEWPKDQETLNKFIIDKYYSLEYAQTTPHHFEDEDGDYINPGDWDGDLSKKISLYDYETNLNDIKRDIVLIKPDYKAQISKEFQNLFK